MSGERGLGASQFGIGAGSGGSGGGNNNNNNTNNYQCNYNHNCCSAAYPDVGRVQVLHKSFT